MLLQSHDIRLTNQLGLRLVDAQVPVHRVSCPSKCPAGSYDITVLAAEDALSVDSELRVETCSGDAILQVAGGDMTLPTSSATVAYSGCLTSASLEGTTHMRTFAHG